RLRPALEPVSDSQMQPWTGKGRQVLRRRPGQPLAYLDAVDVRPEELQHRRLVARAGADLEDPVAGTDLQRLAHQRHDVRMADGLRLTDGQGLVLRGDVPQPFRHEVRA